jgi:hypothetical protein
MLDLLVRVFKGLVGLFGALAGDRSEAKDHGLAAADRVWSDDKYWHPDNYDH